MISRRDFLALTAATAVLPAVAGAVGRADPPSKTILRLITDDRRVDLDFDLLDIEIEITNEVEAAYSLFSDMPRAIVAAQDVYVRVGNVHYVAEREALTVREEKGDLVHILDNPLRYDPDHDFIQRTITGHIVVIRGQGKGRLFKNNFEPDRFL